MKKYILLTLFVAFFSLSTYSQGVYYSWVNGSGSGGGGSQDVTKLTTWNTDPTGNGFGTPAPAFVSGDVYHITNGDIMNASMLWSTFPSGALLVIDTIGGSPGEFDASGFDHTITVQMMPGSTYNISSNYNNLTISSADPTSVFQFEPNAAATATLRTSTTSFTYPTLTLGYNTGTIGPISGTLNVNGILNVDIGSTAVLEFATTVAKTINIGEDFDISSGTVKLSNGSQVATLNISGDLNLNGGTLIASGAAGSCTTNVAGSFNVSGGTFQGTAASANGNPVFNISTNFAQTGGTYTAHVTGSGTGRITLNMNGTGDLSATSLSNSDHKVLINGTTGLASNFTVGNTFTVGSAGTFTFDGFTLSLGNTLTVNSGGNLSGDLSSGLDFITGPTAGISASLPAFTIGTLTINRSSATISMTGNVEVGTILSLQAGTFSIGANTLTVDGAFSGSATITGGTTSNLLIDGASAATTIPVISGGLNTLTLGRSAGSTLGLGSPLSVINLTLTAGLLTNSSNNITIASGGTVTVDDGTLYQTPIYTGTANFVYVGNDNSNTGNEIPSSTSTINNFTLNKTGGASVTLNSNPTVNGTLTISATSTLVAGSHTITIPGSFTVPSGGVFTQGTSTVIFNGTSQTIPALTYNNLTVSSASTLAGNATVNSTLTLGAIITTGTYTLNIASGGVISPSAGTSSEYISGNLEMNFSSGSLTQVFPIGTSTTFAPVTLTFSSVTVGGGITISSTDGDESHIATSAIDPTANVKRFWTITNTGGVTFGTYSPTFTFANPGDLGAGASTSSFILEAYTGSSWTSLTTGTLTSTTSQATGVSIFGDFQIGNQGAVTWNGSSSTSWTTAGNWSSGVVPTSVTSITIPSGPSNQPTIIGAASANSITISSGATLTLGGGSTLAVSGNFANSGTFTDGGGTTTFNGSSLQILTGTATFNNLILNGTGGLTLNGATTISGTSGIGVLSLTKGTLAIGTGSLAIDLDNALIGYAGTDAGTVSGNITVTKSVSSIGNHYLGCPLGSVLASQLNSATTVINASNGETRLFSYTPGAADYTGITALSSTTLTPTTGYSLYFVSAPATLSFDGSYSHGSSPGSVSSSAGTGTFVLFGNPFPSTLDWNSGTGWTTKSGFANSVYYYNSASSSYATYISGVGANGGTQYIPSLQAVYVVTNSGSATIQVNNNARVTSTDPSFYRVTPLLSNVLSITASNDTLSDETVVRLIDGASYNFDSDFDAYKVSDEILGVPNPRPQTLLYTTTNDVNYSINSLPQDSSSLITIPLNFAPVSSGTYTFTANLLGMDSTYTVFLIDSLLNTSQNLSSSPAYSFSINQGDPQGRFAISLRTSAVTSVVGQNNGTKVAIYSYDKKINVLFKDIPAGNGATLSVVDILGRPVLNIDNIDTASGTYSYLSSLPTGIYIAMVNVSGSAYTAKIFIE